MWTTLLNGFSIGCILYLIALNSRATKANKPLWAYRCASYLALAATLAELGVVVLDLCEPKPSMTPVILNLAAAAVMLSVTARLWWQRRRMLRLYEVGTYLQDICDAYHIRHLSLHVTLTGTTDDGDDLLLEAAGSVEHDDTIDAQYGARQVERADAAIPATLAATLLLDDMLLASVPNRYRNEAEAYTNLRRRTTETVRPQAARADGSSTIG